MLRALVDYPGDSDDEVEETKQSKVETSTHLAPTKRKNSFSNQRDVPKKAKALPKLDNSLFIPAPIDDPSKHQGRKRTIPYVEGQFVAHVYVPVKIGEDLSSLLREIVQSAQAVNPNWHSLLEPVPSPAPEEAPGKSLSKFRPHLSLSRPVALRAHQRDDFRKEVRKAAQKSQQFPASFVNLTTLTNDDKSRAFLCVEIGAGHKEFQALSQSLASHLVSLRQLPYYAQPRFHVSIAWILTPATAVPPTSSKDDELVEVAKAQGDCSGKLDEFFRTIDLTAEQLQSKFSKQLLELGRFTARNIEVKIGKEVHKWPLAGPL